MYETEIDIWKIHFITEIDIWKLNLKNFLFSFECYI